MPEITIPDNQYKRFIKPGDGEIFGNLWATKNIDLDTNKGAIRLTERLVTRYSADDDADFGLPKAFIRTNADTTERWMVIAGNKLFITPNTNISSWAEASAGTYTNLSTDYNYDMKIFGKVSTYDRLILSRATDLSMLTGGVTFDHDWWTTTLGQAALTSNPHILHQFTNLLIVADGSLVHTIDDSLVVSNAKLSFPAELRIEWIEDDGYYVYFGTRNMRNGEAYVFSWDGTSTKYNFYFPVQATATYAGFPVNGVMYTVNSNARLLRFNGRAFEEAARFPVNTDLFSFDSSTEGAHLHHNGMGLFRGKLAMLVQSLGGATGQNLEEFPSGLWIYDPEVGLYCRDTLGQSTTASDVSKGGSDLSLVGALGTVTASSGFILLGARVYLNASSTRDCLLVKSDQTTTESNLQHGHFITSQLQSGKVRGFWKRISVIFEKMLSSGHMIIVKYRTQKESNYGNYYFSTKFTATWASTTTLTLTAAANPDVDLTRIAAGDEMEVINGRGEGVCVHVSSVSLNGSTYTVTIDETLSSSYTGTCSVRFRKWTKLGTITGDTTIAEKLMKITKRTPWIQFKVVLRGTSFSPEIEKLLLEFAEIKK